MKRTFTLVLLFLVAYTIGLAQKLVVEDFRWDPSDLDAVRHPRLDLEETPCALVKVHLAKPGATFKWNVIGDVNYNQSVYWVYMTEGTKHFQVTFNNDILPLDLDFTKYLDGKALVSSNTYVLVLSLPNNSAQADDGMSYFTLTVKPKNAILIIDDRNPNTLDENGIFSSLLPRGRHHYKLSATGYKDKEDYFILGRERKDLTEELESVMANLTVRCETPDADIYVNFEKKDIGMWSGSLKPGSYLVEAKKDGFETQSQSITLEESENRELVLPALVASTGLLRVGYEPVYSEVWIDGVSKGTSPNDFKDIPVGSRKVEIKKDGYETKTEMVIVKKGEITELSGRLTQRKTRLPHSSSQSSFYLEGKFQAGMMMGAGASIGAYIYGFNVEGTFLLGLDESEEIAWRQTSQSSNSGYSYTYKPMFYGLKLGYRIPSESRFRFTPQVGIGVASISGSQVQKGSGTDPGATSCYAVPASVGVRLEYNFTKNFGVSASPEFSFPVMKSDTFTKLSDLSSKVKGFGSGFNARVGVFVSF